MHDTGYITLYIDLMHGLVFEMLIIKSSLSTYRTYLYKAIKEYNIYRKKNCVAVIIV